MLYEMKRCLAIILVFSMLSATQLLATDIGDLGSSVKSDFGSWKSPVTGTKYFYGGSYTFAFKGSGSYQPFFQGQAPSAKFGCNGFSLQGGFIALLGLDEIKVLLKNAGATLAWGLLMGLQLTLPSLFNVFNSIRKFARNLQKILSNACNMEKILGAQLGKDLKSKNSAVSGFMSNINSYTKSLSTGIDKFTKPLEDFNKNVAKGCIKLAGKAMGTCKDKGASQTSNPILKVAKISSNSVVSYAIGAYGNNVGAPTNQIYVDTLSNFFDTGKIKGKLIVTDKGKLAEIKTQIVLARWLFGDFATSSQSFKRVLELYKTDDNATGITSNTYSVDGAKMTPAALSRMTSQTRTDTGGVAWITPVVTSAKEAATALIDGITKDTNTKLCSKGKCTISDDYIYDVDIAYDSEGKQKIQFTGTVNTSNGGTIDVHWSGAYIESLKAVRKVVSDRSGYNPTIKVSQENTVSTTSNLATIKVPLLLPNVNKYIDDIVLLEKKARKETPYTAQLKAMIARNNAYMYATSLTDLITSTVLNAFGKKGHPDSSADMLKMQEYLTAIKKKRDVILTMIKADQDKQVDYQKLAEIFEAIDKNIKEDTMKGY